MAFRIQCSASRFNPLIRDNPETIGQFVRDTNRANLKRIGDRFLFFRSGRLGQEIQGQTKTSAGLISVPADHAVHDEYDLMSQRIDEFVDGRLAHSEIKTKTFLSNTAQKPVRLAHAPMQQQIVNVR